jgi:hypothetical protein
MIPCSIPGCTRERPRYSPLCSTHKKVKARHGHPLQVAVKMKELEPYKKAVRNCLDLPGFNGEALTLSLPFQLQRQLAIGIQALNDAGRDCRSR